jgi:hypothetical protein
VRRAQCVGQQVVFLIVVEVRRKVEEIGFPWLVSCRCRSARRKLCRPKGHVAKVERHFSELSVLDGG